MSASDLKWEKANILGHLSLAEGNPQQILNDLRDDGQITSGPLLRTRNPLGYFVAASRKALLPWLYHVHHPQGEFRDNEQLQALERQIYSLINVQVKTGGFVYPERGIWCGTHPLHNQQKLLPHVLKVKNNISVIKEILDFIHLCTNTIIPRKPKYLPDKYCKDLSKSIFLALLNVEVFHLPCLTGKRPFLSLLTTRQWSRGSSDISGNLLFYALSSRHVVVFSHRVMRSLLPSSNLILISSHMLYSNSESVVFFFIPLVYNNS